MSKRERLTRRRVVQAGIVGGAITVIGAAVVHRFRRDLARALARLATVDRRVISTTFGELEYAEHGSGEPLLVVHGIFHGCDGGLVSVRDVVADRRVISPSRFGYLGSALPDGATPSDHADAHVELLDRLAIHQIDVIGISAGTTSALQFALRHADRVRHLVIISGSWPENPTAVAPPRWARFAYGDVPMWALKTFAPSVLARVMGVPSGFPRNEEQARVAAELADSIFPVGPRAKAAAFDAFVSNPDVNGYPLEDLSVPTLVMHAATTRSPPTQRPSRRPSGSRGPCLWAWSPEVSPQARAGGSDSCAPVGLPRRVSRSLSRVEAIPKAWESRRPHCASALRRHRFRRAGDLLAVGSVTDVDLGRFGG